MPSQHSAPPKLFTINDFRENNQSFISGLTGPARGLLVAESALSTQKLHLVIAKDMEQARQIESEARFFLGRETPIETLSLPDWETLPYDLFSPHQDIISTRIYTLSQLNKAQQGVLIVPVGTLLHRLAPARHLRALSLVLEVGKRLDVQSYREELESAGYQNVETVYEHGEFTVRGSIIDVFPMGSKVPYRIELFDDEIETLRSFDPESQRSVEKVQAVSLLPANEFPFDAESRKAFITRWHERFPDCPKESPLYQDIRSGIKPLGVEYYLPLFYDELSTIFDYLPKDTIVVQLADVYSAANHFWDEIRQRFEDRRYDRLRPILTPDEVFLPVDQFFSELKPRPGFKVANDAATPETNKDQGQDFGCQPVADIAINHKLADPLIGLKQFIEKHSTSTLICAESAGRKEALMELFKKHHLPFNEVDDWASFLQHRNNADSTAVSLAIWPLEHGCIVPAQRIGIIAEAQLFGQRVAQVRRRKKAADQSDAIVKNLTELTLGAPVVHIDHGVGRYQGLQTIEIDGHATEFLTLSYANEAKLYVPVTSLHLISRYSGTDNDLAPLHKLGTDKWTTAKQKAMEKIRDTAAELLEVYAKREARKGFSFASPDDSYEQFCDNFPFEETADQLTAIEAIEADMLSDRPMDRLVCGDVGFGKTEVAMRAAFLATYSGKQVAILAPTTLLAQQHYESFKDRFAETPIKIEVLSRFKTGKESSQVTKNLSTGRTDIIVGTHKLLQGDIRFKNLGLLVIDEEHRFGVQQKERIKALRAEVDILTLTATPIPRTLNMAMGGIRDLSIIATPPAKRLSVKTFVRQSETALTKEAILREILRGGQVFYLHNEVKSIEKTAAEIAAQVPEARVSVAHGQMRERELEQIMSDFYHKKFNVLVCTTIIETGIDIPSANTIIIDRADKFGLAQLHQLRGRVGRSHHQAYAYLLTPHPKSLTKDAEKRLEAISAAQDLGAGFTLATHDMEIRGAGELLGEEQSGQIQNIGYSLYMELLDQAVKSIQKGQDISLEPSSNAGAEINLRIPALIPDDYLPDVHSRLILYKRIAGAGTSDELVDLRTEIIDRYGLLPEPLKNLFKQTRLKQKCTALGVTKVDAGASSGKIEFAEKTHVDPMKIVQLVQKKFEKYGMKGGSTLTFKLDSQTADGKLREIDLLLDALKSDDFSYE